MVVLLQNENLLGGLQEPGLLLGGLLKGVILLGDEPLAVPPESVLVRFVLLFHLVNEGVPAGVGELSREFGQQTNPKSKNIATGAGDRARPTLRPRSARRGSSSNADYTYR